MATISDFKAKLINGGARPNQFRVTLNFPDVAQAPGVSEFASFLCRSAQLPASMIEDITVSYRGRPVHFAGERTFQPWTVSIYNDGDFTVRNAIERWSNEIVRLGSTNGELQPRRYQANLIVDQLDRNSETSIKQYVFYNAYPVMVGPIALDFEQNNQIEQFDVEFVYDYYETQYRKGQTVPSTGSI